MVIECAHIINISLALQRLSRKPQLKNRTHNGSSLFLFTLRIFVNEQNAFWIRAIRNILVKKKHPSVADVETSVTRCEWDEWRKRKSQKYPSENFVGIVRELCTVIGIYLFFKTLIMNDKLEIGSVLIINKNYCMTWFMNWPPLKN